MSATALSVAIGARRAALGSSAPRKDVSAIEPDYNALLAGIAQKDQVALAKLHDATVGRVYGFALRITRQREAAEEVVADVYLQVWKQAARFDSRRSDVIAWLLMMCRSRALDYLRRRAKSMTPADAKFIADEDSSAAPDPHDLLLAVERDSRVHAALEQLTWPQRQLLALAFFKGLSHQEIAENTGLPLGTVKSNLRRSLLALRAGLTD